MICNVRPRTKATVSAHRLSYITPCTDTTLVCAVLLRLLKKASSVGHIDNASDIAEKKILVCTKIPEGNNIKFRCKRRVARKDNISFVMSACQFARPRETARFPFERFL